jgi:V8-like Glu-specific endopeptidase
MLHSGTYQCEAFNGVGGSPVKRNKTITVFGECMIGNLYSKSSLFYQILIRVEMNDIYMNVLFYISFRKKIIYVFILNELFLSNQRTKPMDKVRTS